MEPQDVIQSLEAFLSEERIARIEKVLSLRTRKITVVLEDIYQPHNASAVLRSAEAFGIQDIHVISNEKAFRPSQGVSIGADKWLTLRHYREAKNNTTLCLDALHRRGFQSIALSPHATEIGFDFVDFSQPVAFLVGSEKEGLSSTALNLSHKQVALPMRGFSESFNLSVCTALVLKELREKLESTSSDWGLTEGEKNEVRADFYRKSVRAAETILKQKKGQI